MEENLVANIHSFETFGTVDGPGIRFIFFMQGCALRCKYCHNRDTWRRNGGKKMSVDDIYNAYVDTARSVSCTVPCNRILGKQSKICDNLLC